MFDIGFLLACAGGGWTIGAILNRDRNNAIGGLIFMAVGAIGMFGALL